MLVFVVYFNRFVTVWVWLAAKATMEVDEIEYATDAVPLAIDPTSDTCDNVAEIVSNPLLLPAVIAKVSFDHLYSWKGNVLNVYVFKLFCRCWNVFFAIFPIRICKFVGKYANYGAKRR